MMPPGRRHYFCKGTAQRFMKEREGGHNEKKGKTTRSDTLRLQGSSEGNWENLQEHVGRTVGTVSVHSKPCESS